MSLLFGPHGDEDASTHAQDPRQLSQRPHSPVPRRQVTFERNKIMMSFFFRDNSLW